LIESSLLDLADKVRLARAASDSKFFNKF